MNVEEETKHDVLDFLKVSTFGRRKKAGPDKKYATFNRRMIASGILDSLLLMFAMPTIYRLFPLHVPGMQGYPDMSDPQAMQQWLEGTSSPEFVTSWLVNMAAQMLLFFIYSGICWHFWSATPGKMIMRIKIVDADTEQPITDRQIFLRLLGYFISSVFLFLGFFWISFDKRRQGWHDKMANTVVVVLPWRKRAPDVAP